MPYIKQKDRDRIINEGIIEGAGDLNFIITSILNEYINQHELSYSIINELVGVLECAKLELYRRVASPYEDIKIKENGDVYD